ncbi:phage tail protein [Pseudomonas frederiksbergensis]|uniref:Phage tail protein n=1 Tax=Pseudomonas frederiksbergensis TaxID=104087 RepID=A0A423JZJ1_9PSED|nr:phage tail assembly chaperone [Pseudomonas frederiksbergensis]RON43360.1 phage tail protein [Pseudomonas frederiksbergensis]
MIFSSKTSRSFHDPDLGGELPADAIEIATDLHIALLNGQSDRIMISFDTEPPSLVERPPMNAEQMAGIERAWRDEQLAKTDGVVARHRDELEEGSPATLTLEQYTELQVYRRLLRNWPEAGEFPLADHRPMTPPWLTEQLQ